MPIVNGSFESGDFTGWTIDADDGILVVDTFSKYEGNYGCHMMPIDSGYGASDAISQNIGTVTGGRIRGRYRIYDANILPDTSYLEIRLDDGGDELIQSLVYIENPVIGDWVYFDIAVTTPADPAYFHIRSEVWSGVGYYLDMYLDVFESMPYSPPPPTYNGPACGVVTFADVPLTAPSPNRPIFEIRHNERIALNGKQMVIAPANCGRGWIFTCWPASYDEITALKGLMWTSGTLVICNETYTNVYITGFQEREITPVQWEYTVEFSLDNSGF